MARSALRTVLRPVWRRTVERNALCFAQGDAKGTYQTGMQLQIINKCTDLTNPEVHRRDSLWMSPLADMAHFTQELDFVRLMLAAARYRRDTGRYPESVGALVPRYLDKSFLEEKERVWAIVMVPAFRYPDMRLLDREDPFVQACYRFQSKGMGGGRWPESAQELESVPGFSNEWKGAAGGRFAMSGETPAFCCVTLRTIPQLRGGSQAMSQVDIVVPGGPPGHGWDAMLHN
jgi:hypothetical protein